MFPGQVSWRHNNKSLDNSSSTSIIYRQDTQTLVLNISAVSFLDGGPYHCGYQSSGGFTVINKYAVVIGGKTKINLKFFILYILHFNPIQKYNKLGSKSH